MKNIIPLILFLITFQSEAQQPDCQPPSISSRWHEFHNRLSAHHQKTSSLHFREANRLDSVYCYHYNTGNGNYQIERRSFYTYSEHEADLISEYREQQFLQDGFGTWREVLRSLHEYDEAGRQISVVVQTYDETIGTLKNDDKIDFSYLNDEKISEEIFSEWDEVAANWSFSQRTTYAYENEVLMEKLTQDYEPNTSTWLDATRQTFDYDGQQRLIMLTSEIWVEGAWRNSFKQIYSGWMGTFYTQEIQQLWNESDQLWDDANQVLLTYEDEQLVNVIHQSWNENTQMWENIVEKKYTYDPQGELLTTFNRNWEVVDYDHEPLSRTLTFYAADGQITEERFQNWQPDSSNWADAERTRRIYDGEGKETEQYAETWNTDAHDWKILNRLLFTYDSLNYLVQTIKQQPFGQQFVDIIKTDYERDNTGKVLIESMSFSQVDWVLYAQNTFAYNDLEQLEQQIFYIIDFSNNELIPNTKHDFSYQDDGQLLEQIAQFWDVGTATWRNNVREFYTYEVHGNIKRLLRQGWDDISMTWTNSTQEVYHYDENVNLVETTKENWQMQTWKLLEKVGYQYHDNGQIMETSHQVLQNGHLEFFKLIYEYNENDQLISVERQNRVAPIYDWVEEERCDYFYSLPTGVDAIESPRLTCLFPNPYVAGTSVSCGFLEVGKTYQLRVFRLNGQLVHQQSLIGGQSFILNHHGAKGMYLVGVFYQGQVMATQKVFIK